MTTQKTINVRPVVDHKTSQQLEDFFHIPEETQQYKGHIILSVLDSFRSNLSREEYLKNLLDNLEVIEDAVGNNLQVIIPHGDNVMPHAGFNAPGLYKVERPVIKPDVHEEALKALLSCGQRFIAMDEGGSLWAYKTKPNPSSLDSLWICGCQEGPAFPLGKIEVTNRSELRENNWKESLWNIEADLLNNN